MDLVTFWHPKTPPTSQLCEAGDPLARLCSGFLICLRALRDINKINQTNNPFLFTFGIRAMHAVLTCGSPVWPQLWDRRGTVHYVEFKGIWHTVESIASGRYPYPILAEDRAHGRVARSYQR